MGFRQAAVLASTSFFLGKIVVVDKSHSDNTRIGVVLICSNIDYRILRLANTPETLESAYTFYGAFFTAPPAVKVCLLVDNTVHPLLTSFSRPCCIP
jgi:hypothetical protein